MSDAPREPLEPELLPRPPEGSRPGAAEFAPQDDGWEYVPAPQSNRRLLAFVLFLLTCASTFYAGGKQFGWIRAIDVQHRQVVKYYPWPKFLATGLTYSIGIMLILGAHEMGHYLQARRYGVPASLPMFIPMPITPFGTMGAVIVQQAGVADRKSMFDIAISGPLAGLVVALPLNWWGIQHSEIGRIVPGQEGWTNPLIVEWMIALIHHPLKPGEDIALTPVLFAGWVGIFITGLNLIPIGQLDGGHILYCLLGRRAHQVARALYLGAVAIVVFNVWRGNSEYASWTLMLVLIWMMGTRHPPTSNDRAPLGATRIILGWLTLLFIIVGFVPAPIYHGKPIDQPPAAAPAGEPAPVIGDPAKEIRV